MVLRSRVALFPVCVLLVSLVIPTARGATAYTPGEQVLSRLSRSAAFKQARAALSAAEYLHAGGRDIDRGSLRISPGEIQFSEDRMPRTLSLLQVEPAAIKVERTGLRVTEYSVFIKGFAQVFWPREEPAREFADAMYALARYARGASAPLDPAAEAEFSKVAAAYREAAAKPDFPEGARRFRIQAEAALRDKEFDEAADFYAEALKLAPWWPEGRFNRALVLGELKEYGAAIGEMKKYLALMPDAPNARAARDRIYEWEGKAGRAR